MGKQTRGVNFAHLLIFSVCVLSVAPVKRPPGEEVSGQSLYPQQRAIYARLSGLLTIIGDLDSVARRAEQELANAMACERNMAAAERGGNMAAVGGEFDIPVMETYFKNAATKARDRVTMLTYFYNEAKGACDQMKKPEMTNQQRNSLLTKARHALNSGFDLCKDEEEIHEEKIH